MQGKTQREINKGIKNECETEREKPYRKYKHAAKRSRHEMKQICKEREGTEINSLHNGGKRKRQTEKKINTHIIECKRGKEKKYTKKVYRIGLNNRKTDNEKKTRKRKRGRKINMQRTEENNS
jgi:hypothetical protein